MVWKLFVFPANAIWRSFLWLILGGGGIDDNPEILGGKSTGQVCSPESPRVFRRHPGARKRAHVKRSPPPGMLGACRHSRTRRCPQLSPGSLRVRKNARAQGQQPYLA